MSPQPMVLLSVPTRNPLFVAGCLRQVWCQQDKGKGLGRGRKSLSPHSRAEPSSGAQ